MPPLILNPYRFASGISGVGIYAGGEDARDEAMDYIIIDTTGNATDFGDLPTEQRRMGGSHDATRGCWMGGWGAGGVKMEEITYITLTTLGDALDFGDLINERSSTCACNSETRGVCAGGEGGYYSYYYTMDYITIASTGNATDFGDMAENGYGMAGANEGL